jgi:GT2 family glycosyltransferase
MTDAKPSADMAPAQPAPAAVPPASSATAPPAAASATPLAQANAGRVPARLPEAARLGIILVNWQRAADTIECLESIFSSTIPLRVVVVDNGSNDGSLDYIAAWAAGTQPVTPLRPEMAKYSQPPVAKPIATRRLDVADLPTSGGPSDVPLTLINSGGNLGFAAGNNIGLRLLLTDPRITYFWLLNNDTVIEPTAAAALVTMMSATHKVGMCGTVVRFYHKPDTVQALNGNRFNLWTGQSRGIGAREPASKPFNPGKVAKDTDFVLGASLATSREFLETVGPMDESFFLYYEEIEWAKRSDGRFSIGFAHGATVYHKEGGSIGSSGVAGGRSGVSEYWLTRSRLRFIRRYAPILLPWHWLLTLALIGRRILRRHFKMAAAMTRALFGMKY